MDDIQPLRIFITGATGTGKTSVAKKLAELLSLEYLELNSLILEKGLYFGYDINRESVIIDDDLLISYLKPIIANKKRLCLVGGVIPLKETFTLVVVLRCHVDVLRQRLIQRNYSKEKIEANVEAEIMNILYYDAIELLSGQNVIEVFNDEHSIEETCDQIISIVRQHHPSVIE